MRENGSLGYQALKEYNRQTWPFFVSGKLPTNYFCVYKGLFGFVCLPFWFLTWLTARIHTCHSHIILDLCFFLCRMQGLVSNVSGLHYVVNLTNSWRIQVNSTVSHHMRSPSLSLSSVTYHGTSNSYERNYNKIWVLVNSVKIKGKADFYWGCLFF